MQNHENPYDLSAAKSKSDRFAADAIQQVDKIKGVQQDAVGALNLQVQVEHLNTSSAETLVDPS